MKRVVFLIMILTQVLFGYNYDEILLKAQANIYPKILLLDKDIGKKVTNNRVIFTIVYHESDFVKALKLKNFIQTSTGKKLGDYDFKVQIKEFSKLTEYDQSNGYYILQGDISQVERICNIAKKHHIPTFSYEYNYIFHSVLISLLLKDSSVLYFNKDQNEAYDIHFINSFYQIVRFAHAR